MLQCNMEAVMKQATVGAPTTHAHAQAHVHEHESSSFGSLILGWAQQGFDSFLATQRILMDFATRKGTGAMKSLREGLWDPEHSPVAILTELAVEMTANLTEAQRVLLNLAQQENEIVMTGVKERVSGSETAAVVTDRVRRGIDTIIEMQQDLLTTFSKHAQNRLQATKSGKMPEASCVIEAAREAMDDFVRAQKKFLDVFAADGVAHARSRTEEAKKKTELSKLAREAANSFIDAQKKLLDLAGQQVNVNLQAASRTFEMLNALRPRLLPSVSGEDLKSFVRAEKEAVSKMVTPPVEIKVRKTAPRKRAAARRRPATQAAAQAV
jgi:hypothetical protein